MQSSVLLGEMQAVALLAHDVRTGIFDYRAYDPVPSSHALAVFVLLRKVAEGLVVDRERALAEVHADYSTATELADALPQRADVPARVGYRFASRSPISAVRRGSASATFRITRPPSGGPAIEGAPRTLQWDGIKVIGSTPEELAKYIITEHAKWANVVKRSGATVQ